MRCCCLSVCGMGHEGICFFPFLRRNHGVGWLAGWLIKFLWLHGCWLLAAVCMRISRGGCEVRCMWCFMGLVVRARCFSCRGEGEGGGWVGDPKWMKV